MKKIILCCSLFLASVVFADAGTLVVDAGTINLVVVSSDAGTTLVEVLDAGAASDAGVLASTDAGVAVVSPSFEAPLTSARGFYDAVRSGNGWLAAMCLLFLFVGGIRLVGKRIHAMIPDDTTNKFLVPVEKLLYFIFDTKIGGWVLNWLSAIGGCLLTASMAGLPVDASSWKVAILASTGGTAIIELKDDVMEWWDKKNADKAAKVAAEAAAKAAVIAAPASTVPPPPAIPPVETGMT